MPLVIILFYPQVDIERSVAQYRKSLFVVVQPLPEGEEEDFNSCLIEALKEKGIPFVELKEPNQKRRVKIMQDLVTQGKVPLSNFSLR